MRLVQHYNDLTEINQLRYIDNGSRQYGYGSATAASLLEELKKMEGKIKTRFAFTDVKTIYGTTVELMDKAGWTIAKKTCDWHDVHKGDSELRLYYKVFPENKIKLDDKRERQPGTYPCHRSLAGSCSMGLITNFSKDFLQSDNTPERYLNLVRITGPLRKETLAKMKYYRYTKVFESEVARYFANGWTPEEYMGEEKEHEWWKTAEAPKKNGFVYKPRVRKAVEEK